MADQYIVRKSRGKTTVGQWAVYDTQAENEVITFERKSSAQRDANRRNRKQ